MSRVKNAVAIIAITGLGVVGVTKMFGTTASSKFHQAQTSVAAQVVFGSGSPVSASTASRNSRTIQRQPQPAAQATSTREDARSTFALDVDTGSYTIARRHIESGVLPDAQTVRAEEFINYFQYSYEPPASGRTATVRFEGAPSPFAADRHLVSVGLRAADLTESVPVHLTFLVDTSGSMDRYDRLPLAKESIRTAVRGLSPLDTVSIVTYSGSAQTVLESTRAFHADAILAAVDGLSSGGGTAMSSGMELAYRSAAQHSGRGRVSRVIVMSDGDANIGATSPDSILDRIRTWAEEGVTVSTIGFGMGNYRDDMMERLANAGDGNYAYIDSRDEAMRTFGDRLQSMLHVVAHDTKAQLEFDPRWVVSWRQIGYENRQMADHEFRNDHADGGELGAGHQVTALYELELADDTPANATLATVRFRYKPTSGSRAKEVSFGMKARSIHRRVGYASDDFRFQAAVATFADVVRGRDGVSYGWIHEVAESATADRTDRENFLQLVRRAGDIERRM